MEKISIVCSLLHTYFKCVVVLVHTTNNYTIYKITTRCGTICFQTSKTS
jgi:hypothetical protein